MTGVASYSQLQSAFDNFLFATIGDDKNGMLLSVNSALARSGVDPWEEAATLARLPAETTGADIDRIMAEARRDAAKDLVRARSEWGKNAAWARKDAVRVETSADLTKER